jgi:hypothetical protein
MAYADNQRDRERVREFFADLEPSECRRLFEFFSHQPGYKENKGAQLRAIDASDGGLDPEKVNAAKA